MKTLYTKALLVLITAAAFLSGCTKDKTKNNAGCLNCPDTVSFKANIIPIFQQNCAIAGCHDAADNQGRVTLDSAVAYAQATQAGTGYVNAGSPNTSVLLSQLYAGANDHMPQGGQLDDCTIQKIYCWIQQGALNN